MPFNSAGYFLFLAGVFLVYFRVGERHRWLVLLIASAGFYAAARAPHLIVALSLVTAATWFGGRWVAGSPGTRAGSALFWGAVGFNLMVLVCIRYLPAWVKTDKVFLSVGVSYYVFQSVSYLVDVYAGVEPPENHPGLLALYLAFFPKLLQGPIERAGDLLPQLRSLRPFAYEDARAGFLLFAWGLFKKIVIADRLGLYVDAVYGDVHAHSGLTLLLATYFYAGQIYYDFSGYTDMALGSARLFGIRLTQNFRAPYLAVSIADFWRRWHISFSRWILDYIFKPLQMSFRDGGTAGTALALVVTFAVCGAWHGVGGTFLLWGLFHGILMAASLWTAPVRKRVVERLELTDSPLWRAWRIAATFHLVCFGWIFFRANGLGDAVYVATHLFSGAAGAGSFLLAHGKTELSVAVASVAIVAAVSSWDPDTIAGERLRACRPVVRWAAYYALTAAMLFFAADRTGRFIYFQF